MFVSLRLRKRPSGICRQPRLRPQFNHFAAAAGPQQTPDVRGRRAAAIAARKRALRGWDKANPDVHYDPDYFRREVLPGLAEVKFGR